MSYITTKQKKNKFNNINTKQIQKGNTGNTMYSTKTIEKILLTNTLNKKSIQAAVLNPETKNQYQMLNSSEELSEVLARPEYSQAIQAYREGRIIYRGARRQNHIKAAIVTPGIRISQNTSNIYTRLVSDVFLSWQDFPKRNRSTICSTSYVKAEEYAYYYPHVIFPQNGTKIGICSQSDFWDSFPFMNEITNINQMSAFNGAISEIFENVLALDFRDTNKLFNQGNAADIKQIFYNIEKACLENMNNPDEPIKYIKSLDRLKTDYKTSNKLLSIWYWKYYLTNGTSLLDFLEYIMLPKKNKFRMISIDKIPKKANKEVWFEGQYLMIREDVATEIFN